MHNKLMALKDLGDLLCKYNVKDLEDLENKLKNVADLEAILADKTQLERAVRACHKQNNEFNTMIKNIVKDKKQLKKALSLAREYMLKGMCAEDVPSEEWFIKQAHEEKGE